MFNTVSIVWKQFFLLFIDCILMAASAIQSHILLLLTFSSKNDYIYHQISSIWMIDTVF